jgi:hypothetical protein
MNLFYFILFHFRKAVVCCCKLGMSLICELLRHYNVWLMFSCLSYMNALTHTYTHKEEEISFSWFRVSLALSQSIIVLIKLHLNIYDILSSFFRVLLQWMWLEWEEYCEENERGKLQAAAHFNFVFHQISRLQKEFLLCKMKNTKKKYRKMEVSLKLPANFIYISRHIDMNWK